MNSPLVCPNMCRWLDDIQRQTFAVSPPAGQVKLLRQWIISFGHHTCMADWEESRKGRSFKLWIMTNLHHFQLACDSQIKQTKVCNAVSWEPAASKPYTTNPPSCTSFCCVKCKRTAITPPLRLSAKGWGWNCLFQFCSGSQLWSGEWGLPEGSDSWTGAERQVLSGRGEI